MRASSWKGALVSTVLASSFGTFAATAMLHAQQSSDPYGFLTSNRICWRQEVQSVKTHKWYPTTPGATSYIPVSLEKWGGGAASGDSSFKDPNNPPMVMMPSPYGEGYPNHRLVGYPCPQKKKTAAHKKTTKQVIKKKVVPAKTTRGAAGSGDR